MWLSLASITIVIISVIPIPENVPLGDVPLIDKWVHFVIYGGVVLAAWLDRWLNKSNYGTSKFAMLIICYSSLLGGLMELVQGLTPYRSCDWIDFYADAIGALLATIIGVVVHLHLGAVRHPPS